MCFSSTASFTAGAVLAGIGVLTLKKVKRKQDYVLASVPLLFALQQLTEGLLWRAMLHDRTEMIAFLSGIYIAFAGIVWPLIVPLGVYLIEPQRLRRYMILLVLAVGGAIAFYTVGILLKGGVHVHIVNACIRYEYMTGPAHFWPGLYIASSSAAFFFSGHRSINAVGVMNAVAFAFAYYSAEINMVSGWCFLAAIVSAFIYLHFSPSLIRSRRSWRW